MFGLEIRIFNRKIIIVKYQIGMSDAEIIPIYLVTRILEKPYIKYHMFVQCF